MGGTPTPPLTESPLSFSKKFFPKRTKSDVFVLLLYNVKNAQKGHIIDEKGLEVYGKSQKKFLDLNYLLLGRIFLNGIRSTHSPPLTEKFR